ncbi:MAG: BamA/TamA family outer membrane protein [candidate division Zixibacteria bacterium]|nr:BamA/TamA family outer membrane protein [candidate division Zixibacteria bacterium]
MTGFSKYILIVSCAILSINSSIAISAVDCGVAITVDPDRFQIQVDTRLDEEIYYSLPPDNIEILYEGIRLADNIYIGAEGIEIDGLSVEQQCFNKLIFQTDKESSSMLRFKNKWNLLSSSGIKFIYTKAIEDSWAIYGNLIIDQDEIISGDVVNVFGDAEIYGEVRGDVVSVYGDVFLDSTAVVKGDIITAAGEIITAQGAEFKGDIFDGIFFGEQAEGPGFFFDENKSAYINPLSLYNRVVGFDMGLKVGLTDRSHSIPDVYLSGGYSFGIKRWHYDLGFKNQLFDYYAFVFGGSLYRKFDNSDGWIISTEENSLAALFLKEDFYDMYSREGYELFIDQWFGFANRVRFTFCEEEYGLLSKNTNWAIFGRGKYFRENYSFLLPDSSKIKNIPGDLLSININYELDTRQRITHPYSGWYALAEYERAGNGLGGDFDYNRYRFVLQRYQPLTPDQFFNIRLMGGFSEDELPPQKMFTIGGIGTMRGFDYKQFYGNYMILANLEYVIDFSDFLSTILFVDAGKTGYDSDSFENEKIHKNVGLAVMLMEMLRINIARPVDEMEDDIRVTMRVSLPF